MIKIHFSYLKLENRFFHALKNNTTFCECAYVVCIVKPNDQYIIIIYYTRIKNQNLFK